jgi:hypothetical protein
MVYDWHRDWNIRFNIHKIWTVKFQKNRKAAKERKLIY